MNRAEFTVVAQLLEITKLEDGWDGYGGLKPSMKVVENVWVLVDLWYPRATDASPNTNGTISFEWEGTHLEVGETRFSMYNKTHFIDGQIKGRND